MITVHETPTASWKLLLVFRARVGEFVIQFFFSCTVDS